MREKGGNDRGVKTTVRTVLGRNNMGEREGEVQARHPVSGTARVLVGRFQ